MKRLLVLAATLPGLVIAAISPCSIHPPKGAAKSSLAGLAKVTRADAEKTALAGFADFASPASVAEGELEAEHGCLVYSFDIKVAGHNGVEEVLVDAGTGKILSRKHETSSHEAAEARHAAAEARAESAKAAAAQSAPTQGGQ